MGVFDAMWTMLFGTIVTFSIGTVFNQENKKIEIKDGQITKFTKSVLLL